MKRAGWIGAVVMVVTCGVLGAQSCPGDLLLSVVDPTGIAVPGAKVSVACHAKDGDQNQSGTTDKDGRYTSGQLTWEPCDVKVEAPGYVVYRKTIQSAANNVGLQAKLRVARGAAGARAQTVASDSAQVTLQGSVVDPTGEPAAGAYVEIGQKPIHLRTDKNGRFQFREAEGTYHVEVGFAPFNRIMVEQAFTSGAAPEFRFSSMIRGGGPSTIQVQAAGKANWEYGVFLQGGVGLEERTDFSFVSAGGQLGRRLTGEFGPGLLKGDFEYAVQVVPLWQSYTPQFQRLNCPAGVTVQGFCHGPTTTGGTYRGASLEPIILRWNFTKGRRLMPWVQAAGGVLYTTRKYPGVGSLNSADPTQTGPAADTSVWNFTPQGGVGAHYFLSPRRSVDFSANGVHISSASLGDKNPGVNVSLQVSVGYTWWK